MGERVLNESQKYCADEFIERANSRGRDRIDTIDELRAAIENQDCEYGKQGRITEEDFFERSGWFYCSKCRQLLDGGYARMSKLDKIIEELKKEQEEEGEEHEEEIVALKEIKERYPNCKAICWDCLWEYIGRKKVAKEIFGVTSMSSLTDDGLKGVLCDCQQKIIGLKEVMNDIKAELAHRKEEAENELAR